MKALIFILFLVSSSFLCFAQTTEDVLAGQYVQSGEFEKALNIYQKLFNQGRDHAQYYDAYFNTLIKLKKYDEAEKLAKKMAGANKGNYSYQIDIGRVLRERGQLEKTAELYNNLIKSLPKDESAIRDLSITFYRADAYEFSVKTLLSGRKLLNDETAFSFDLLALYRYQKNKEMLVYEYVNILGKDANVQLISQAKNVFSTLFESSEDYDVLKSALLRKLQKDPQNIAYSELLAWQYIQQKEFDMALKQIIALDKRLKEDGDRVYDLITIFIKNKAYEQAVEGLEYLLTKGPSGPYYVPAKIQILYTKNQQLITGKFSQEELMELEKDYLNLLQEFGKTRNTVFAIRQLASLQASHLNKAKTAEVLLEEALKIPGLTAAIIGEIKLELGDIYILTGEKWEAALIYGQVEKGFANEPLGQEAKFKNAKLSYYQGDFIWAKAQLDVLKSSTSQLIANDALNLSLLIAENTESEIDTNALRIYARSDFLIFINQYDKALKTLDSIKILYPENALEDDILMSKARIFQKQNLPDKSIEQLNLIVASHSNDLWADDALFMLAEIYEVSLNDKAKASDYYQKIIIDFPGSLYVTEARKRFRLLRGDNPS